MKKSVLFITAAALWLPFTSHADQAKAPTSSSYNYTFNFAGVEGKNSYRLDNKAGDIRPNAFLTPEPAGNKLFGHNIFTTGPSLILNSTKLDKNDYSGLQLRYINASSKVTVTFDGYSSEDTQVSVTSRNKDTDAVYAESTIVVAKGVSKTYTVVLDTPGASMSVIDIRLVDKDVTLDMTSLSVIASSDLPTLASMIDSPSASVSSTDDALTLEFTPIGDTNGAIARYYRLYHPQPRESLYQVVNDPLDDFTKAGSYSNPDLSSCIYGENVLLKGVSSALVGERLVTAKGVPGLVLDSEMGEKTMLEYDYAGAYLDGSTIVDCKFIPTSERTVLKVVQKCLYRYSDCTSEYLPVREYIVASVNNTVTQSDARYNITVDKIGEPVEIPLTIALNGDQISYEKGFPAWSSAPKKEKFDAKTFDLSFSKIEFVMYNVAPDEVKGYKGTMSKSDISAETYAYLKDVIVSVTPVYKETGYGVENFIISPAKTVAATGSPVSLTASLPSLKKIINAYPVKLHGMIVDPKGIILSESDDQVPYTLAVSDISPDDDIIFDEYFGTTDDPWYPYLANAPYIGQPDIMIPTGIHNWANVSETRGDAVATINDMKDAFVDMDDYEVRDLGYEAGSKEKYLFDKIINGDNYFEANNSVIFANEWSALSFQPGIVTKVKTFFNDQTLAESAQYRPDASDFDMYIVAGMYDPRFEKDSKTPSNKVYAARVPGEEAVMPFSHTEVLGHVFCLPKFDNGSYICEANAPAHSFHLTMPTCLKIRPEVPTHIDGPYKISYENGEEIQTPVDDRWFSVSLVGQTPGHTLLSNGVELFTDEDGYVTQVIYAKGYAGECLRVYTHGVCNATYQPAVYDLGWLDPTVTLAVHRAEPTNDPRYANLLDQFTYNRNMRAFDHVEKYINVYSAKDLITFSTSTLGEVEAYETSSTNLTVDNVQTMRLGDITHHFGDILGKAGNEGVKMRISAPAAYTHMYNTSNFISAAPKKAKSAEEACKIPAVLETIVTTIDPVTNAVLGVQKHTTEPGNTEMEVKLPVGFNKVESVMYVAKDDTGLDYTPSRFDSSFLVTDGVVTSVESINDSPIPGIYNVYNLKGMPIAVNAGSDALKQLTPGTYIINGKKTLIK